MMSNHKKKRVVVAMSGGVDSSMAAVLLKQQGYEVIGISLKLWDYNEEGRTKTNKTCCSYRDIQDARRVCDRLEIPFYAFSYKKEFEKNVIQTFVSEYTQGRTPNPCILCNQHIKFDRLLEEAKKLGADYLATGHYARVEKDEKGAYRLLKGTDPLKDQSYVLFGLNQEILKKVLFPIGDYTKDQIRKIAEEFDLPTASKPESQDICFVPDHDYAKFVAKYDTNFKALPGNFVDVDGHVLGRHEGIHAYTVGQRRGLGIAGGERLYVTRIDVSKNEIELSTGEGASQDTFIASRINWISPFSLSALECGVKVRYQKDEILAIVEPQDETSAVIRLKNHYRGITPGQAAVFYRGNEVLGGGWIE